MGLEPTTTGITIQGSTIELPTPYLGGNGEIRTHGAISDSTVFKTVAINRALPRFLLYFFIYMIVMMSRF